MFAFGKSGFGACRGYCFFDNFGVTFGFDYVLCNKNCATYRTMLAFRKTGFRTSRCYRFVDDLGVTFCFDNGLLYNN